MTTVNVNEDKYSVTVTEGATTVVTVKAPGPQGPGFPDGNLGDVTSSNTGASVVVNSGAITNAKVASDAAIAGSKISPTFSSQLLVHQATAPQIRINSASNDSSATRFTFGLATGTNQFINGASSNDSCIATPSNILFGISNTRKFRIKTNDVLTDVDFIPSANDGASLGRSNARWSDLFVVDANISGNLTVSGTTTTINTQTLDVEDINITLGKVGSPTDITADGGGITLLGDTNHTFNWVNATDSWTSSEHIALPDNKELKLGSAGEVRLSHTGTSTNFIVSQHFFNLQANGYFFYNQAGNETLLSLEQNGAVKLYHDNIKRLETASNGAACHGRLTMHGDIVAADNHAIKLGTGLDFTLVHDGTHSVISNNSGNLKLEPKPGEKGIVIVPDGSAELYHDNVKIFQTQSWGSHVFGSLVANGDIKVNQTSGRLRIGVNDEFTIRHNSTNLIAENTVGNIHLRPKTGEEGIKLIPDGAVELYHDNVKRFETTASGILVNNLIKLNDSGAIFIGSDNDVNINHSGTNFQIHNDTGNTYFDTVGTHFIRVGSGNEAAITAIADGAVELYFNNVKKVETSADGLDFPDNSKLQLGDSQDLQLYHDSNNSVIDSNTGDFYILTAGAFLFNTNNKAAIKCVADGAVELYFNGIKRFNTTADAVDVHGHLNLGANTDDKRLRFGINNDLQLYHDATDSHILNSTGILKINSTSGVAITGGLLFGSDTADANKLEDYEEGTWTPTFNGLTASNTSNACFYIKIGDMVTAWFRATMPTSSDTTTARIQGLPFNIYNSSGIGIAGGAFSETNAGSDLSMIGNANTDNMFVLECNSSGVTVKTLAQISGKDFRGSITYRVA